ncbi:MAG: hypothetical protein KA336_03895 [Fusobacteriaceae bacterium]|nr:hypothetical protein [Fusobacteriaceae bacterium]
MRFIDNASLERLNIESILNYIEPLSNYGQQKLNSLTPYTINKKEELKYEFFLIDRFIDLYNTNKDELSKVESILHRFKDIKKAVESFHDEYIFQDIDFFQLKTQLILMEQLEKELVFLPENLKGFQLIDINKVVDILDPNKDRMSTFYVYDFYSKKLEGIRDKKRSLEREIYDCDDPEKIAELKLERLKCVVDEEQEEFKVRKKLMHAIEPHISDILNNIEKIAKLDFIMAKARFAINYGGVLPKISDDFSYFGKNLINLELKAILKKKGKVVTPVSINLETGTNLITGANMGGKSIALKTITQNLVMFHYGIFPIAEEVKFPIVDFIFFISDDMQDLSKGLSTFGAEIIKLKEVGIFLELGRGFVVFDEFARGTNPEEGKRFVSALAKFLNEKNSISLLTTHFDGIANDSINHYQVVGLKNVDFENLKLVMSLNKNSLGILQEYMDYSLEKTNEYEVPKYALNIGELLGMNMEFLNKLKDEYKEEN